MNESTNTATIPKTNSELPLLNLAPQRSVRLGQLGKVTSYRAEEGEYFNERRKPSYYQLAAWDSARRTEPIIFDGLQKITYAVERLIGAYEHIDPEIEDFIKANIEGKVKGWASQAVDFNLWSSFSTAEKIYKRSVNYKGEPRIYLKDLVFYHPLDVRFVLDDYGRLSHGKCTERSPAYNTGVWVPTPSVNRLKRRKINKSFDGSYIRLPENKVFHSVIQKNGNSPYGTSFIEPILKYHIYKDIFLEMEATALDRYGTPLLYAVVPQQVTTQMVETPDGSSRQKYYYEVVQEVLEDARGQKAIVLSQLDKDHPVKIDTLTTANNFSSAFTEAIELCDNNMMMGLGIPNLIMKNSNNSFGTGGASERQMEAFHSFISRITEVVLNDILDQIIYPLIRMNFDPLLRPTATYRGSFAIKPFRTSEVSVLKDMVQTLTDKGYIDSNSASDRKWVRSLFDIPEEKPSFQRSMINDNGMEDFN